MKKHLRLWFPLLLFHFQLPAQPSPITIKSIPNQSVTVTGDLVTGAPMPSLNWAWNSSNACFVQTQQEKFTGHHLLFRTDLPRRAEMTIRLIPANPDDNLSLYAYSLGKSNEQIVPDLPRCVSCEASFQSDFSPGEVNRKVQLRAINNPYNVFIGVAGSYQKKEGAFTLEISLEGGEEKVQKPQEEIPIYRAPSEKGKSLSYSGDLADGKTLQDLSWAWNSSNACFVQTQASKYSGHHILFLTEIHRYSEMTITLIPENKAHNLSLYAYMIGHSGDLRLVPDLPSCVTCEADFYNDYQSQEQSSERQVSLRAVNNPYRVIIGVSGAEGLKEGRFVLRIAEE